MQETETLDLAKAALIREAKRLVSGRRLDVHDLEWGSPLEDGTVPLSARVANVRRPLCTVSAQELAGFFTDPTRESALLGVVQRAVAFAGERADQINRFQALRSRLSLHPTLGSLVDDLIQRGSLPPASAQWGDAQALADLNALQLLLDLFRAGDCEAERHHLEIGSAEAPTPRT